MKDDPEQCTRAERVWRRGVDSGGVFLALTVLVEVAWVLRTTFKVDRAGIASKLLDLLDSSGVVIENETLARAALSAYAGGSADFSDCVIREAASGGKALPVLTFDDRFARHPGVELVPVDATP